MIGMIDITSPFFNFFEIFLYFFLDYSGIRVSNSSGIYTAHKSDLPQIFSLKFYYIHTRFYFKWI